MGRPLNSKDLEALAGSKRFLTGNRVKFFSDLFPYLVVPVLVYNLVALFADGDAVGVLPAIHRVLDDAAFTLPMLSGVTLRISWGELMVVFSTIFLFIEVIKSTNTASVGIVNHIFSMLLFVVCLIQFLMFASFATGTFFIITCIVLVDALAGMVVTIISARRDFGVEGIGA